MLGCLDAWMLKVDSHVPLRSMSSAYGFHYLDLWHLEGARYNESCMHKNKEDNTSRPDHHYICHNEGDTFVSGEIGEATTQYVAHTLIKGAQNGEGSTDAHQ